MKVTEKDKALQFGLKKLKVQGASIWIEKA
jgi:hypothetical protein